MIKISWPLMYMVAVSLDLTLAMLLYFGLGVILNPIINFFVILSLATIFNMTQTKGWIGGLIFTGAAEEIPPISYIVALIPIWWTLTIWRIHKKNAAVGIADLASRAAATAGGEQAGNIRQQAVGSVSEMQGGAESNEQIVKRQREEDQTQEPQEQYA